MAVVKKAKRQYLTISEIQDEYLPISKKKIRILVKKYLPARMLGNRIFVDRAKLEELLSSEDGPTPAQFGRPRPV